MRSDVRASKRLCHALLPIELAGFLALLAPCAGCSGSKSTAAPEDHQGGGLSVPECEAYAAKVAECFHRDDARAAIAVVAQDDAERTRLAQTCSSNLQRLRTACR